MKFPLGRLPLVVAPLVVGREELVEGLVPTTLPELGREELTEEPCPGRLVAPGLTLEFPDLLAVVAPGREEYPGLPEEV